MRPESAYLDVTFYSEFSQSLSSFILSRMDRVEVENEAMVSKEWCSDQRAFLLILMS